MTVLRRHPDVHGAGLSIAEWRAIIDSAYSGARQGAIRNVDEARGGHFDAIFVGGGSAGRFGAAVLRSLGGRALVLERWPFLGGSCPHQACVPHHLFSEAARELDQWQALQGRLWFPPFDPAAASILELVQLFRAQRSRGRVTSAELDRALAEGRILRTHALRSTWHFVYRQTCVGC